MKISIIQSGTSVSTSSVSMSLVSMFSVSTSSISSSSVSIKINENQGNSGRIVGLLGLVILRTYITTILYKKPHGGIKI